MAKYGKKDRKGEDSAPQKRVKQKDIRRSKENRELEELEAQLANNPPPAGCNPASFDGDVEREGWAAATTFEQLPLSLPTKQGLAGGKFVTLTEIQRAAIPHALCGRDVLGAAKTGSGKTLAFVIPTLEVLFRNRWSRTDGLGALIISPVRELAMQTFDVFRIVGKNHNLSAGLIVGGKSLTEEQERIYTMTILVATPGRLLQHMDETPGFDCSQLKMLVLDEADRILDCGFEQTMSAIFENLPSKEDGRQTMLFSATMPKTVRALAALSLKDPEFISVHERAEQATPARLTQHYLVCELYEKLDQVYSFVKTHLNSKSIIFFSSCNQVRFVYDIFCRLQPGVIIMCLHGKIKQERRALVFQDFCSRKAAVLFATDIAARGLDFPAVDWVVQADCPEDSATYVHRVGRTARYQNSGRALLLLSPSEMKMIDVLNAAKIPLHKTQVNPSKVLHIKSKLQAFVAQDLQLKFIAQKAFVSYLRSVHLQANKEVFNVKALPFADYASSMGLPGVPRIRFLQSAKIDKNKPYALRDDAADDGNGRKQKKKDSDDEEDDDEEEESDDEREKKTKSKGGKAKKQKDSDEEDDEDDIPKQSTLRKIAVVEGKRTKMDKTFLRKNQDVLSDHFNKFRSGYNEEAKDGEDSDEEFLKPKKTPSVNIDKLAGGVDGEKLNEKQFSRKSLKKIKKDTVKGTKTIFDEEGNEVDPFEILAREKQLEDGSHNLPTSIEERMQQAREKLSAQDKEDRQRQKDTLREQKFARKMKLKAQLEEEMGGEQQVFLGGGGGGSDDEGGDYENDDQSEDFQPSSESEEERGGGKKRKQSEKKGKKKNNNRMRDEDSESDDDGEDHRLGAKMRRKAAAAAASSSASKIPQTLADEEEMALNILKNRSRF